MSSIQTQHPKGAPQPEPFQQYVPLAVSYTKLSLGSPPEQVTETRHLIYTHFSYRKMAEAFGVDLVELSREQRRRRRRIADLTRQHGRKRADQLLSEEIKRDGAKAVMGAVGDIEIDDLQSIAVMTWAAMITEDPALTVDNVLQMMTITSQPDIIIATVKAYNIYMQGEAAAELDYESIRGDIEDGLKGEASQEAVSDALGVSADTDAAEAAEVQQARSSEASADNDDAGDPGNG